MTLPLLPQPNLRISNITSNSMTAVWDPVVGAGEYRIYLNSSLIATTLDPFFSFERLTPNTRFVVEVSGVRVIDDNGNITREEGEKSFASATTLVPTNNSLRRVIVPNATLPSVNNDEDKYIVRYRIISDDRNRLSHWSPQYFVEPLTLSTTDYFNTEFTKLSNFIYFTWDLDGVSDIPTYDIFVSWGLTPSTLDPTTTNKYFATVSANNVNIPILAGKQSVQITIQKVTFPKRYLPSMIVAQSSIESLV